MLPFQLVGSFSVQAWVIKVRSPLCALCMKLNQLISRTDEVPCQWGYLSHQQETQRLTTPGKKKSIWKCQTAYSHGMLQVVIHWDEVFLLPSHAQDTFLPHVECGTVTLIGATTENPSFQVNAALLSRCRVIVLEKLSVEAMEAILMRAVRSLGVQVLGKADQHDSSATGSSSESSEWVLYGLQGLNAHSPRNWLPARERMKQLGGGKRNPSHFW